MFVSVCVNMCGCVSVSAWVCMCVRCVWGMHVSCVWDVCLVRGVWCICEVWVSEVCVVCIWGESRVYVGCV